MIKRGVFFILYVKLCKCFSCFKFLIKVLFEYKIFIDNYILTFINLNFFFTVDLLVNFTHFFSHTLFNNQYYSDKKTVWLIIIVITFEGIDRVPRALVRPRRVTIKSITWTPVQFTM